MRTSNFNIIHSVEGKAQLCPGHMNNGAYKEQLSRDEHFQPSATVIFKTFESVSLCTRISACTFLLLLNNNNNKKNEKAVMVEISVSRL